MARPISAQPESRDIGLDALRGLAILLVMLFHWTVVREAPGVLHGSAMSIARMGWCGVDLFFVLSGFLITGILLRTRESSGYFKSFYWRRFLRIVPLYYLVLFVFLAVVPRIGSLESNDYFWVDPERNAGTYYWLFLSNLQCALQDGFRHDFLSVTWSLAVEEQFYVIWPLVVLFTRPSFLAKLCVGLIVTAFLLRTALVLVGADAFAIYVLTPCRMDTLAAGAFVAVAVREPQRFLRWVPLCRQLTAGCFCALSLLVLFLVLRDARAASDQGHLGLLQDPLMQSVGFSLLTVGFAAFLGLAHGERPSSLTVGVLRKLRVALFAKYSYAMYLVHLPVMWVIRQWVIDPRQSMSPWRDQLLVYVLALAVTTALAWLCWRIVEQPILQLRTRLSFTPTTPLGPADSSATAGR